MPLPRDIPSARIARLVQQRPAEDGACARGKIHKRSTHRTHRRNSFALRGARGYGNPVGLGSRGHEEYHSIGPTDAA